MILFLDDGTTWKRALLPVLRNTLPPSSEFEKGENDTHSYRQMTNHTHSKHVKTFASTYFALVTVQQFYWSGTQSKSSSLLWVG